VFLVLEERCGNNITLASRVVATYTQTLIRQLGARVKKARTQPLQEGFSYAFSVLTAVTAIASKGPFFV